LLSFFYFVFITKLSNHDLPCLPADMRRTSCVWP